MLLLLLALLQAPSHLSGSEITFPPSGAIVAANLQNATNWKMQYDPGTSGSASGTTSVSNGVRSFHVTYTNGGGELYYVSYAKDETATHFLYDAWVEFDSTLPEVANLEMDMNQVLANGDTVIFGFQCDGYNGVWDYTENAGTRTAYVDKWLHSNQPCNPRKWTPNVWHHVQIAYYRDAVGNITYQFVRLDGTLYPLQKTVPSAFSLGWSLGTVLTNFQIDGLGSSGSVNVYLKDLSITRW